MEDAVVDLRENRRGKSGGAPEPPRRPEMM
jgi:hypothetical protein